MLKPTTLVATALALVGFSAPLARAADLPVNTTPVTDGDVNAAVYDDAGRAYVGGSFGFVGPRLGSNIALAGTTDTVKPGFPDVAGTVLAVVQDGAGGEFIGGRFSAVGGVPRARLAHIFADGSLDANWNPGATGIVRTLALSPSGDAVYVGGDFQGSNSIGGQARNKVAKLSPTTGVVDPTWNPDVFGSPATGVRTIAASATNVYIGGNFFGVGDSGPARLAKLSATGDGAPVDSWAPAPSNTVNALALSGTELYVGGFFTSIGGQARNYVAKLDSAGTGLANATWNPDADAPVTALQLSGTGHLFLGGLFFSVGGNPHAGLAKVATTGTGDDVAAWNPNPGTDVHALGLSGGELVVAGDFNFIGGAFRNYVARVSLTGTGAASAWDPNPNGPVQAIGAGGAGVYLAGDFSSAGSENEYRGGLIRLNANGSLDKSFDPRIDGVVNAISLHSGELIVGGIFGHAGQAPRLSLAKLNTTNGAVTPWTVNVNGPAVNALLRSGDDLYVGGEFLGANSVGNATRNNIAKVSAVGAGAVDPTWDPNVTGPVSALALAGGALFVGGSFADIDGSGISRLAKVSATGAGHADATWSPDPSGVVSALVASGPSLYVGGNFFQIGGKSRGRLAKLSTAGAGAADSAFDAPATAPVNALALSGDSVYVGGLFGTINGVARSRLARVSAATGDVDTAFEPVGSDNGGGVAAVAATPSRVLAGGDFNTLGPLSTESLGVFDLTAPTLSLTSPFEGARFRVGQSVPAAYTCDDPDGAADALACVGNVPSGSPIDTGSAGAKTFTATATDAGGKSASSSVGYVVDGSAPDISIPVPADGSVIASGTKIPVSFSCIDADGPSDVASCVGSAPNGSELDISTPGAHSFTVTAADQAGNSNTKTVTYTVPAISSPPVLTAPVLSVLRINPKKFKAGRGARVSYRLSSAARVTFTVKRGRKRVGSFTRAGKAGANSFKFKGKVKRRTLKPGSYKMSARAKSANGLLSETVVASFKILKR